MTEEKERWREEERAKQQEAAKAAAQKEAEEKVDTLVPVFFRFYIG